MGLVTPFQAMIQGSGLFPSWRFTTGTHGLRGHLEEGKGHLDGHTPPLKRFGKCMSLLLLALPNSPCLFSEQEVSLAQLLDQTLKVEPGICILTYSVFKNICSRISGPMLFIIRLKPGDGAIYARSHRFSDKAACAS